MGARWSPPTTSRSSSRQEAREGCEEFNGRYLAAGRDERELDKDRRGYTDGVFGVCLRFETPEAIVRKASAYSPLLLRRS